MHDAIGMFWPFYNIDEELDVNTISSDDLTVEVIFFGEGPASGNVTLNKEASASASPADVQAKL
jgi:hypothetical protein